MSASLQAGYSYTDGMGTAVFIVGHAHVEPLSGRLVFWSDAGNHYTASGYYVRVYRKCPLGTGTEHSRDCEHRCASKQSPLNLNLASARIDAERREAIGPQWREWEKRP